MVGPRVDTPCRTAANSAPNAPRGPARAPHRTGRRPQRRHYTAGMSIPARFRTGATARKRSAGGLALLAAACAVAAPAGAQGLQEFSTRGLPRSEGVVVRVKHPSHWQRVAPDDDMAVAELRGRQGPLTGILQIGRGGRRTDLEAACRPERARTMLQGIGAQEPDARVTDVFARSHEGRPAFEVRYERNGPGPFLRVRSVIVCLKDSRLVVSCAGSADQKAALEAIEPVCSQVLESLSVAED